MRRRFVLVVCAALLPAMLNGMPAAVAGDYPSVLHAGERLVAGSVNHDVLRSPSDRFSLDL